VGYLPENPYFYDFLTAWEFLEFAGKLFHLPDAILKERIPALLELVGLSLEAARKKQLRTFSKGMLQRTGMAQALINDPDLVFLDEPMSGLDPIGRYQMREIILSLKRQGKTVFFNSHLLGDVEAICDRVGLLVQGKLVCQGRLDQLLNTSEIYHVKGRGGQPDQLQQHLQNFHQQGELWRGEWSGGLEGCVTRLTQLGAEVTDLHLQRQSLEEFFVAQVQAIQGNHPVSS
jgi:ABC-2 type transport system ATP-binding protein